MKKLNDLPGGVPALIGGLVLSLVIAGVSAFSLLGGITIIAASVLAYFIFRDTKWVETVISSTYFLFLPIIVLVFFIFFCLVTVISSVVLLLL